MYQVIQIIDWTSGYYFLFGLLGIVCGYVATQGLGK